MTTPMFSAFSGNFLGNSPTWYKQAILGFLILNPLAVLVLGPFVTGWLLLVEFIFTLAMALRCYPLQPGGLLALEAVLLGLTTPEMVYQEVLNNLTVIFLLMFMVAGIFFMKDLLLYIFTKMFIRVRSKVALSLLFSVSAATLSAFLDALTVTAVLIAVSVGFYSVYHRFASGAPQQHDFSNDLLVQEYHRSDLDRFRAFLRSLVMHGAVGTALGGVCTMVGEPQNVIIAQVAGWDFGEFFLRMAPITMPVLVFGLSTVIVLEKAKVFGYGATLPDTVYKVLVEFAESEDKKRSRREQMQLITQGVCALLLVGALAFHVAEIGLIGLTIIILLTSFNGITEEHRIGRAFEEALPFTSLLVVFFAIVAVIHGQHLFTPIINWVLSQEAENQAPVLFVANGLLSAISDNVFVATVYISEVRSALEAGEISREHFNNLAVAVNTGTNLPSVATPNGQAAFLFLLTSALAPLIRLSYGRMVMMALPYTLVFSVVGITAVVMAF
ncbi:sodium/proton antiporter NhaB [Gilvimarinus sp. F26214L]|uniref:sodium/proton antiporter NhaB n=1 Tax=Gilvimarinus sp. DZF01 TaxID=3461371 RepID=UPI0040464045